MKDRAALFPVIGVVVLLWALFFGLLGWNLGYENAVGDMKRGMCEAKGLEYVGDLGCVEVKEGTGP